MEQTSQQVYAGIAYSYMEYINAYHGLLKNNLFFSLEFLDEETFQIEEELKALYLSLPTLLSDSSTSKEEVATRLLDLKTALEIKYRVLTAYKRELFHLVSTRQKENATSPNYLAEHDLSEEELSLWDFNALEEDCVHFIFKDTSVKDRQLRAAKLLPLLPMRITKDNFLSLIRKSIDYITINDTTQDAMYLISILNQLFDGKNCPGYGKHFSDLTESIAELNTLLDPLDFDEEADMLNEMLDTLFEILTALHKMICTLSNLLLFDQVDFNTITEMHPSFFDLYHCLKRILENAEDEDLLLESLSERIPTLQKELKTNLDKVGKKGQKSELFKLIETYLTLDIKNAFGFGMQKKTAYSPEICTLFDTFIDELQLTLMALPPAERKQRMQYLLGNLPFVMTESNFKLYVNKAFESLSTPGQRFALAMSIYQVLENGKYFSDSKSTTVAHYENDHLDNSEFVGLMDEDLYDEEGNLYHTHDLLNGIIPPHHVHTSNCQCGHDHDDSCDCGDDCQCDHEH